MSSKQEQPQKIAFVYCVTSFGKIVGVYADPNDAFQIQMQWTNKGRVAEMVPQQIVYPLKSE